MDSCKPLAPVLIPTLCRDEHLAVCLESLAGNEWAKDTPVYVALDYPASEAHYEGYRRVCKLLDEFDSTRFSEFHVIKRNRNYGPGVNSAAARDELFERYGRLIFAEDDLEFAPGFLEYMNRALMTYKDDPRVDAVCGYSYPLRWSVEDGATAFFCDSTYSTWGYGTWDAKRRKREERIRSGWLVEEFPRMISDGSLARMVENARCEYLAYAGLQFDPDLPRKNYDFVCRMYLAATATCTVVPTRTLVRNHGFDGSGWTCSHVGSGQGRHSQDYGYDEQPICSDRVYDLRVDERMSSATVNGRLLDAFLYTPPLLKVDAAMALSLYRVFGNAGLQFGCKIYKALRRVYRNARTLLKQN